MAGIKCYICEDKFKRDSNAKKIWLEDIPGERREVFIHEDHLKPEETSEIETHTGYAEDCKECDDKDTEEDSE